MKDSDNLEAVVDAINDLTRVTIAIHGKFASKSEAVRRLSELSIPSARIAKILAMAPGDVSSALAKAKRSVTVGTTKSPRESAGGTDAEA